MSNRTNGASVRQFEAAFAQYVGAKYAIAMCNGTATLHTALVALGVKPGDRVAVPPLTMASTTLAVLHAGAVPLYEDIDSQMWLMNDDRTDYTYAMPVSLYGLAAPYLWGTMVDDAAQTLNCHPATSAFTSYSFQASKILSAGEGGCLVTDDHTLYAKATQFSRLGYPSGSVRDFQHPAANRHVLIGYNYRMADCQAALLLPQLERADAILAARKYSADCYLEAVQGCPWMTSQYVPEGWHHSWWTYAIALDHPDRWEPFAQAIVKHGGERPYAAWRITYQEPAFRYLAPDGTCPVAEDLQPRLMQLQTNHDKPAAERVAEILALAIKDLT